MSGPIRDKTGSGKASSGFRCILGLPRLSNQPAPRSVAAKSCLKAGGNGKSFAIEVAFMALPPLQIWSEAIPDLNEKARHVWRTI